MRNALLYGLWATICFALTSVVVFVLAGSSKRELSGLFIESLPVGIVVLAVASLAWLVWHRDGRQPRLLGYGLMAIAVTLAVHLFFVAFMLQFDLSRGLADFAATALLGLMFHGWFTIPVALAATALFVAWQRRQPS